MTWASIGINSLGWVASCLVALIGAGCGHAQLYEGDRRPTDEVAILHASPRTAVPDATARFDGRKTRRRSWELLPGERSLEILLSAREHREDKIHFTEASCRTAFAGEAGMEYELGGSFARGCTAWIREASSGQVVADCNCRRGLRRRIARKTSAESPVNVYLEDVPQAASR